MKLVVTEGIERLQPYAPGKPAEELLRETGVANAIKLASNENPLGPSPSALRKAREALAEAHRYPDATCYRLRQALADRLGVDGSQLVFGNGSNELIELVIRTYASPGDHVVYPEPSFVVYRSASLVQGLDCTTAPLCQGAPNLRALAEVVSHKTRLVMVANPNNPTSGAVGQEEFVDFMERIPDSTLVTLDEAYFEYVERAQGTDGVALLARFANLIVLRTFSKAYGLAALRVGYSISSPDIAQYLERVRAPFNVNSVAEAAALGALEDAEHLRRVVEHNRAQRHWLTEELRALGLNVYPSSANFVFARFGRDVQAINEQLLREGVIVRPIPVVADALRISVGSEKDNQRLMSVLHKVVKSV